MKIDFHFPCYSPSKETRNKPSLSEKPSDSRVHDYKPQYGNYKNQLEITILGQQFSDMIKLLERLKVLLCGSCEHRYDICYPQGIFFLLG